VQVDHTRLEQVRLAMVVFGGVWVGVWLPISAQAQVGRLWDVPPNGPIGDGEPGSWGGHAVYATGYDADGVRLYTWGREQRMSWLFWKTYVDESYALVTEDYLRTHVQTTPRGLNVDQLRAYLAELG
jgi:hypothetical protein